MKRVGGFINGLPLVWEELEGFDYVDRMVVWLFMMVSTITLILYLSEHATEAEVSDLTQPVVFGASLFDLLAYTVFFFLIWPLVRYATRAVSTAVSKKYRGAGGEDS